MNSFSLEDFQKAFELENLGIWKLNISSMKLSLCCMMKKFLGLHSNIDEISFEEWRKFIHPEDQNNATEKINSFIRGEVDIYKHDVRLAFPDGTYKWYAEKGTVVSYTVDGKPEEVFVVVHEITDRKSIENQLKQEMTQLLSIADMLENMQRKKMDQSINELNAELLLKNKELEQLIYIASHDLRSPLVNIQGFTKEIFKSTELIRKKVEVARDLNQLKKEIVPLFEEELPDSFHFVISNAEKMDNLVAGLLRFSRIGRVMLNQKMINTNEILSEVLKKLHKIIKKENVRIVVDNLPACYADESLLIQVFYNVIENSLKFLRKDKLGEITISASADESMVTFCIADNGIGIPHEYHDKIFEIFDRLDISKKGDGIGLAVVKKIIGRHQGKIWVESVSNQGSKFYFTLFVSKKAKKQSNLFNENT